MEFYLEFNDSPTKIVYNNKYKPTYFIHRTDTELSLLDLDKKSLGKITKSRHIVDTYEFEIPNDVSGRFLVLTYFASNFLYIPKLKILVGGNTKQFNFSVRKGTKKIATTSSVLLKNGPHISINIDDKNHTQLIILLIELFDQIGFLGDDSKRKLFKKNKKIKIAYNICDTKKDR